MNTYESKQKQLFKPQAEVYAMLSDLTQLEKYAAALPAEHKDKIKDLNFTTDSISFKVDMLGEVVLRIVDYETPKMLKFGLSLGITDTSAVYSVLQRANIL